MLTLTINVTEIEWPPFTFKEMAMVWGVLFLAGLFETAGPSA